MKIEKIAVISVVLATLILTVPFASAVDCCSAGKVTGGGWFVCDCYGARTNFGFNVVREPGETVVKGELEYHDHTNGFNVHAHDFDSLCVSPDGKSATFTGPCTINHEEGFRFKVYVEDNGEPGCANSGKGTDVFEIWLYTLPHPFEEYHAVGHPIDGGNIQIHWVLPDP